MTIQRFSPSYLQSLVTEAASSKRLRQHRNIHATFQDPCQRFMNAIGIESYIRPHRHAQDPKSETLIAVRGVFALVVFDDDGNMDEAIKFGTERNADDGDINVGLEIPPGCWHTIVSLKDGSILLELKAGPFNPSAAKEPAPWAPEEGTEESAKYFLALKQMLKEHLL